MHTSHNAYDDNSHDIDKSYISPYDKLLFDFDKTHVLSASQEAEINKAQRIAAYRDNPIASEPDDII